MATIAKPVFRFLVLHEFTTEAECYVNMFDITLVTKCLNEGTIVDLRNGHRLVVKEETEEIFEMLKEAHEQ